MAMKHTKHLLAAVGWGDAIGAPFETNDGTVHPTYKDYNPTTSPLFLPTPRLGLSSGQWTDDTIMSVALAESLIETKGKYNQNLTQEKYVESYFLHPEQGWGGILKKALDRVVGVEFDDTRDGWTIGNGALMRAAPFAAMTHWSDQELYENIKLDASITHRHPDVVGSVFVYVSALKDHRQPRRRSSWTAHASKLFGLGHREMSVIRVMSVCAMGECTEIVKQMPQTILSSGSTFSTLRNIVMLSLDPYGKDEWEVFESEHSDEVTDYVVPRVGQCLDIGGDTDSRLALVAPFIAASK